MEIDDLGLYVPGLNSFTIKTWGSTVWSPPSCNLWVVQLYHYGPHISWIVYVCVYVCVARNINLSCNLATALGDWTTGQTQQGLVTNVCTCASLVLFLDEGRKATNALYASGSKHVLIILYDCVCVYIGMCVV